MFVRIPLRRAMMGAVLAMLAGAAGAQTGDWPNRPIRLVVAGPAGAGMDIYARLLAAPLQAALKTSIVVDNKAGANSLIGNDAVAKAAPDGYTLLFTPSSAVAINPIVVAKMPYDTLKDLLPVAQIGAGGILLMTNPASGFKSLQDMVRYAKANPGKLTYGSWGNGSTGHLVMEGIKVHYGLDMQHVPYKGTAAVVNDLLGDNIKVAFTDIASPVPHIRSGKLVAMGATGSGRGPALPEVPTLTEQGYKFDADGWYGMFAPAGTPMPIVRRINEEINKILATDEMRQKFASQNMLAPPIKTADQFANTVRSDVEMWQSLAKAIKLKID
ncbi:MAG: tripartite tricarboxylate transporter substrate binding protein [Burkholderiaceae bacterium]|nr:tripartite tricarboxylate transporter substrate binding protein [Burkholderiaceae bacterium]MBP6814862.1 tripartite tricarboxylate transporter substrate binding protein [Burkholderiaceae bacterium]MBP7660494.1 tripartite tricarboxylate transporter substrate binding protein [Burkholderiaceae bacterium]